MIDAVTPHLAENDRFRGKELREHLDSPVRVALVGRVSAGKSTLLNALVGERLAPTNNTECTQVVTWFRFGTPKRLEVKDLDGVVKPIEVGAQHLPDHFGLPPDRIDYAVAYIPAKSLREYEIFDTPGLGGEREIARAKNREEAVGAAATRRALIGRRGSRGALPKPDITILLCNTEPRGDELEFLSELGASRLDTLVLLSHADNFGGGVAGSGDPITKAADHALRVQTRHASVVSCVVPVAALLAEAALAGQLTEDDARALGQLSEVDDRKLDRILGGAESSVSPARLDRLDRMLGVYGIVHGRKLATKGARAVCDWLTEASGLADVREQISCRFVARGEVLKARHVLTELDRLAMSAPGRTEIKTILETAQLDPGMHALRELKALDGILRWDNSHPLVAALDHMSTAGSDTARLGIDDDSDAATIGAAAKEACLDCRRQRHVAFAAAEKEAWTVLETSYQRIFQRQQTG